jgi:hypothetical protein
MRQPQGERRSRQLPASLTTYAVADEDGGADYRKGCQADHGDEGAAMWPVIALLLPCEEVYDRQSARDKPRRPCWHFRRGRRPQGDHDAERD